MIKIRDRFLPVTIFLFILNTAYIFAQEDTVKFAWPYAPMNVPRTIGGTFGEYRSTSEEGHYHNANDMSGAAGTPIVAVLPGTVAAAYDDGATGYNSYVRINSTIDGKSKQLTYLHTRPTVSTGQSVEIGDTISRVAIDHVHLIEYRLGGALTTANQINSLRPGGGLTIYNDIWKPHIRSVRFFVDNSNIQLPSTGVGGKVDIIVHIEEVNGTAASAQNNGTFKAGYKILSADSQTVIYNPPTDGLRYHYLTVPLNNYVNYNYYQPESNTSKHVYILTNGNGAESVASSRTVLNNYWDAGALPLGKYVVMIYTEDTRGNTDTVYVPVNVEDVDLTPPSPPELKYVKRVSADTIEIAWNAADEEDLKGFRIYYSFDGVNYQIRENENKLTADKRIVRYFAKNMKLFFKITAVDSAFTTNESAQSDEYALKTAAEESSILLVDGFDRYGGSASWNKAYHNINSYYADVLELGFESASNDALLSGDINLTNYKTVVWMSGDESTVDETFSKAEQELVKAYLIQGGKLFVTGSEIGWDLSGAPSSNSSDKAFLHEYLKSEYASDDANSNSVIGEPLSVFEGIQFTFGTGAALYIEDYPDVLDTTGGSIPVLKYSTGGIAGTAYTGIFGGGTSEGQVIFMALPFETIPAKLARAKLMDGILTYFGYIINEAETDNIIPSQFMLHQNYPNPFNPSTNIVFDLAVQSNVKILIYDILGNIVDSAVDDVYPAGRHILSYDASNLSSGVYFYKISAGNYSAAKKMVFLK